MMDAELAEYFDRVRYTDIPGPNLSCLSALHLLHPQQIPFENIDQITGRPGSLDLSVIFEKLVRKAPWRMVLRAEPAVRRGFAKDWLCR